jgi:hypothetical protein
MIAKGEGKSFRGVMISIPLEGSLKTWLSKSIKGSLLAIETASFLTLEAVGVGSYGFTRFLRF